MLVFNLRKIIKLINREEIKKLMSSYYEKLLKKPTVYTFGFGTDHSNKFLNIKKDANMIKEISDEGNGSYYFLEKQDDIPKSFADCLGGLLSIVSQNIILTIELKNNVKIGKFLSKNKVKNIDDNKIEINIGDSKNYYFLINKVLSEEKRDILFSIKIPKISKDDNNFEICNLKLDYLNVINMKKESIERSCNIKRVSTLSNGVEVSIELDKHRNRLMAAEAIERAKKFADDNKLEEAKKEILQAIETIKRSPSRDLEFCQFLIDDLNVCKNSLKDRVEYVNYGSKFVKIIINFIV
jgi:hypothetical protein